MSIRFFDVAKTRLFHKRKIMAGPELTPCWLWTGCLRNGRYGDIVIYGKRWLVHRLAYTIFNGPVLPGLELDHLCAVTLCFNPKHLDAVTHTENILRGKSPNLEKVACPRGHTYDKIRVRASTGRLRRHCHQCALKLQKESRQRKRLKL